MSPQRDIGNVIVRFKQRIYPEAFIENWVVQINVKFIFWVNQNVLDEYAPWA